MKTNKDLKYNHYEGHTLFIKKDKKIEGMSYGIARMNKDQLKGLIECLDLSAAAYPIPRNMRERLENVVLPRFYEISDLIDEDNSLPNNIGIEISKLNQEDILYGLESKSIKKLLEDRGFESKEIKKVISRVNFVEFEKDL